MKTVIFFKTRNGATEQYARWLAEDLGESDVLNISKIDLEKIDWSKYQRCIFASPNYSGEIIIKDELEKLWKNVDTCQCFLLVVGMVPQKESWSKKAYEQIPDHIRDEILGYVKLPGVMPESRKPNAFERLLIRIFLRTSPKKIYTQKYLDRSDLEGVKAMINKHNNNS